MPLPVQQQNTVEPGGNQPWVCIAPMMKWTDRHYRFFMRTMTRHTLLYTEMITCGAVIHGDREHLLGFSPEEKPLALQVGGNNPDELARCTRIAEELGYDEINLNVGCPSERVQDGRFGACLMARPAQVARAVEAMKAACRIPVTVKCRIGISSRERYEHLHEFVHTVASAGCDRFIVHARVAVLGGFSPKQNRTIPPLRYDDVYRLKADFPYLTVIINGGIRTLGEAVSHLRRVDGFMIGRAAYENPYLFAEVDSQFFDPCAPIPSRREIIHAMVEYIDSWVERGLYPNHILKHMHGLFAFRPGSRAFKRYLSEFGHRPGTTGKILLDAIRAIPDDVLDERGCPQPVAHKVLPAPASAK